MLINMPDDHLIFLCGADAGTGTAVDMGKIIKTYLYGDPNRTSEREMLLGIQLVRRMLKQMDS